MVAITIHNADGAPITYNALEPSHQVKKSNRLLFGLGLDHPRFQCLFHNMQLRESRDEKKGVLITLAVIAKNEDDEKEALRLLEKEFLLIGY